MCKLTVKILPISCLLLLFVLSACDQIQNIFIDNLRPEPDAVQQPNGDDGESVLRGCKYDFDATVRSGPSEGLALVGTLAVVTVAPGVLRGYLYPNDDGEALGLENDQFQNEDKMNLHLVNVLRQRIGSEHLVHVDIRFDSIGDKRVVVVKCSPSQLPVYHRDGNVEQFYIRTGAATTELMPSEIQGYLKQRF